MQVKKADPVASGLIQIKRHFSVGSIVLIKMARDPVMINNKLFGGYHAVQDWSRVAVHRYLHWTGTGSWRREATILLSVLVALMAGYITVFHFASHAVQDLVDTCTARLEIELENADTDPLTKALARPLCECVAHSFLDKNGIVRLAMVNMRMLDSMALDPVTEKDEVACISALWLPNVELAKRLTP
ncbi:hypothetical protein [Pseudomonas silesiensis]|uniref:hypothetical protein n=1 Tax=Pseudomonas silesiensis TaxID=1853130 RepID=UPI0034D5A68F